MKSQCRLSGVLCACLVGCLALAVCAVAEDGKLVWSEGFEGKLTKQGLPQGWARHWDLPAKTTLTLVTDRVAEGKQALRMECEPHKSWWMITAANVSTVKPLTTYTFSFKIMFDVEGGKGHVMVRRARMAQEYPEIYAKQAPMAGGYKEFKTTFMTGPNTSILYEPLIAVVNLSGKGVVYVDDMRMVEGGDLKLPDMDQPVPFDRLLPVKHTFPRLSVDEIKKRFEQHHQASEKTYRGDGSWESSDEASGKEGGDKKPPLMRATSQRVFGYLGAYAATKKPIYLQRAKEGLDWLVSQQQPSGQLGDAYYESGLGGAALVEGYLQFKDERYLAAAERVAIHAKTVKRSWNFNYNMFLIWAASRYATVSGNFQHLRPILNTQKLLFTIDHQRSWGGWDGHNSKIGYHCTNLRAMAALDEALPKNEKYDALRLKLRRGVIGGINRMIVEQQPVGGFPFEHGRPETTRHNSGVMPALTLVHEAMGIDTTSLTDAYMTYIGTPEAGKYWWLPDNAKWLTFALLHAEGVYLKWEQTSRTKGRASVTTGNP